MSRTSSPPLDNEQQSSSRNEATSDPAAEREYSQIQGYLPSEELREQVDWANECLDNIFDVLQLGKTHEPVSSQPPTKWSRRQTKLPADLDEAKLNEVLSSDFIRGFLPQIVPFLKRAAAESVDRSSETLQRINLVFYKCVRLTAVSLPWCHVGLLDCFCSLFSQAFTTLDSDSRATSPARLNTSVSEIFLPGSVFGEVRGAFVDALRLRKQVQRRKHSLRAFTKRSMDLVGRCVRHTWESTELAYCGMIVDYSPSTRKHLIHYVDGEKKWVVLDSLHGLCWLKDKFVKTPHRELEMSANDVDKVLQVVSKTLKKKKVTYDESLFDFETQELQGHGFQIEELLTIKAYDSRTHRHLVVTESAPVDEPRWIDVTEDMVPYAYRDTSMRKIVTDGGDVKVKCYIIRRKCSALGHAKWYVADPRRKLAFNRSDKGLRIRIWWPGEKQWFKAIVRKFVSKTGKTGTPRAVSGHLLKYDDGEKKWYPDLSIRDYVVLVPVRSYESSDDALSMRTSRMDYSPSAAFDRFDAPLFTSAAYLRAELGYSSLEAMARTAVQAQANKSDALWNKGALDVAADKIGHFLIDCGGFESLVDILHSFWRSSKARQSSIDALDGAITNRAGAYLGSEAADTPHSRQTLRKAATFSLGSRPQRHRRASSLSHKRHLSHDDAATMQSAVLLSNSNLEQFRLLVKVVDTVVDFICPSFQRLKLLSALYAGVDWIFRNIRSSPIDLCSRSIVEKLVDIVCHTDRIKRRWEPEITATSHDGGLGLATPSATQTSSSTEASQQIWRDSIALQFYSLLMEARNLEMRKIGLESAYHYFCERIRNVGSLYDIGGEFPGWDAATPTSSSSSGSNVPLPAIGTATMTRAHAISTFVRWMQQAGIIDKLFDLSMVTRGTGILFAEILNSSRALVHLYFYCSSYIVQCKMAHQLRRRKSKRHRHRRHSGSSSSSSAFTDGATSTGSSHTDRSSSQSGSRGKRSTTSNDDEDSYGVADSPHASSSGETHSDYFGVVKTHLRFLWEAVQSLAASMSATSTIPADDLDRSSCDSDHDTTGAVDVTAPAPGNSSGAVEDIALVVRGLYDMLLHTALGVSDRSLLGATGSHARALASTFLRSSPTVLPRVLYDTILDLVEELPSNAWDLELLRFLLNFGKSLVLVDRHAQIQTQYPDPFGPDDRSDAANMSLSESYKAAYAQASAATRHGRSKRHAKHPPQALLVERLALMIFHRMEDHEPTGHRLPNSLVMQGLDAICSVVAFADAGILDVSCVKFRLASICVGRLKDNCSVVQSIILLSMVLHSTFPRVAAGGASETNSAQYLPQPTPTHSHEAILRAVDGYDGLVQTLLGSFHALKKEASLRLQTKSGGVELVSGMLPAGSTSSTTGIPIGGLQGRSLVEPLCGDEVLVGRQFNVLMHVRSRLMFFSQCLLLARTPLPLARSTSRMASIGPLGLSVGTAGAKPTPAISMLNSAVMPSLTGERVAHVWECIVCDVFAPSVQAEVFHWLGGLASLHSLPSIAANVLNPESFFCHLDQRLPVTGETNVSSPAAGEAAHPSTFKMYLVAATCPGEFTSHHVGLKAQGMNVSSSAVPSSAASPVGRAAREALAQPLVFSLFEGIRRDGRDVSSPRCHWSPLQFSVQKPFLVVDVQRYVLHKLSHLIARTSHFAGSALASVFLQFFLSVNVTLRTIAFISTNLSAENRGDEQRQEISSDAQRRTSLLDTLAQTVTPRNATVTATPRSKKNKKLWDMFASPKAVKSHARGADQVKTNFRAAVADELDHEPLTAELCARHRQQLRRLMIEVEAIHGLEDLYLKLPPSDAGVEATCALILADLVVNLDSRVPKPKRDEIQHNFVHRVWKAITTRAAQYKQGLSLQAHSAKSQHLGSTSRDVWPAHKSCGSSDTTELLNLDVEARSTSSAESEAKSEMDDGGDDPVNLDDVGVLFAAAPQAQQGPSLSSVLAPQSAPTRRHSSNAVGPRPLRAPECKFEDAPVSEFRRVPNVEGKKIVSDPPLAPRNPSPSTSVDTLDEHRFGRLQLERSLRLFRRFLQQWTTVQVEHVKVIAVVEAGLFETTLKKMSALSVETADMSHGNRYTAGGALETAAGNTRPRRVSTTGTVISAPQHQSTAPRNLKNSESDGKSAKSGISMSDGNHVTNFYLHASSSLAKALQQAVLLDSDIRGGHCAPASVERFTAALDGHVQVHALANGTLEPISVSKTLALTTPLSQIVGRSFKSSEESKLQAATTQDSARAIGNQVYLWFGSPEPGLNTHKLAKSPVITESPAEHCIDSIRVERVLLSADASTVGTKHAPWESSRKSENGIRSATSIPSRLSGTGHCFEEGLAAKFCEPSLLEHSYFNFKLAESAQMDDEPTPNDNEQYSVSRILELVDYDELHSLMDITSLNTVTSEVWEILQLLPVSPALLNEIMYIRRVANKNSTLMPFNLSADSSNHSASMGNKRSEAAKPRFRVAWQNLFCPHNCCKLLYALQLVDGILSDSAAPAKQVTAWCYSFAHLGGLEYLMAMVLRCQWAKQQRKFLGANGEDSPTEQSMSEHDYALATRCLGMIFKLFDSMLCLDPKYIWSRRGVQSYGDEKLRGAFVDQLDRATVVKFSHTILDSILSVFLSADHNKWQQDPIHGQQCTDFQSDCPPNSSDNGPHPTSAERQPLTVIDKTLVVKYGMRILTGFVDSELNELRCFMSSYSRVVRWLREIFLGSPDHETRGYASSDVRDLTAPDDVDWDRVRAAASAPTASVTSAGRNDKVDESQHHQRHQNARRGFRYCANFVNLELRATLTRFLVRHCDRNAYDCRVLLDILHRFYCEGLMLNTDQVKAGYKSANAPPVQTSSVRRELFWCSPSNDFFWLYCNLIFSFCKHSTKAGVRPGRGGHFAGAGGGAAGGFGARNSKGKERLRNRVGDAYANISIEELDRAAQTFLVDVFESTVAYVHSRARSIETLRPVWTPPRHDFFLKGSLRVLELLVTYVPTFASKSAVATTASFPCTQTLQSQNSCPDAPNGMASQLCSSLLHNLLFDFSKPVVATTNAGSQRNDDTPIAAGPSKLLQSTMTSAVQDKFLVTDWDSPTALHQIAQQMQSAAFCCKSPLSRRAAFGVLRALLLSTPLPKQLEPTQTRQEGGSQRPAAFVKSSSQDETSVAGVHLADPSVSKLIQEQFFSFLEGHVANFQRFFREAASDAWHRELRVCASIGRCAVGDARLALNHAVVDSPGVGLTNLGSTCYLNSFVQLLYHSGSAREAILAHRVNVEQEQDACSGQQDAGSGHSVGRRTREAQAILLREKVQILQILFASMEACPSVVLDTKFVGRMLRSADEAFEASTFVARAAAAAASSNAQASVVPPVCPPVFSAAEQRDVHEFGLEVFSLFESTPPSDGFSLNGKRHESEKPHAESAAKHGHVPTLAQTVGGTLRHTTRSQSGRHMQSQVEAFSMLSVDVEGHSDLLSALAAMVSFEVLDGPNKVQFEGSRHKSRAIRQTVLDELPGDFMLLHLKRFKFDPGSMSYRKISARCTFPDVIDFAPFTTRAFPLPPVTLTHSRSRSRSARSGADVFGSGDSSHHRRSRSRSRRRSLTHQQHGSSGRVSAHRRNGSAGSTSSAGMGGGSGLGPGDGRGSLRTLRNSGFGTDSADDFSWHPGSWNGSHPPRGRERTFADQRMNSTAKHRRSYSGLSQTVQEEDDLGRPAQFHQHVLCQANEHQGPKQLPCEEQKFGLAGIIVHDGTFKKGHYFTLIKLEHHGRSSDSHVPTTVSLDPGTATNTNSPLQTIVGEQRLQQSLRPNNAPAKSARSGSTWVMYNDDKVSYVSAERVAELAFGVRTSTQSRHVQSEHPYQSANEEHSQSAYILMYRRLDKKLPPVVAVKEPRMPQTHTRQRSRDLTSTLASSSPLRRLSRSHQSVLPESFPAPPLAEPLDLTEALKTPVTPSKHRMKATTRASSVSPEPTNGHPRGDLNVSLSSIDCDDDPAEQLAESPEPISAQRANVQGQPFSSVREQDASSNVVSRFAEQFWQQHSQLFLEYSLFDSNLSDFLWELLCQNQLHHGFSPAEKLRNTKILTHTILTIVWTVRRSDVVCGDDVQPANGSAKPVLPIVSPIGKLWRGVDSARFRTRIRRWNDGLMKVFATSGDAAAQWFISALIDQASHHQYV